MADSVSETLTDNGSTGLVKAGARGEVFIRGADSFGGGTVTIEILDTDGTYRALIDSAGAAISYTAAFSDVIDIPVDTTIRATLSGATTPNLLLLLRSF